MDPWHPQLTWPSGCESRCSIRGIIKWGWASSCGAGCSSRGKFSWACSSHSFQLWSCEFFASYSWSIFFHWPEFLRDFWFHGPTSSKDRLTRNSTPLDPGLAWLYYIMDSLLGPLELYPFSTTFGCLDFYVFFNVFILIWILLVYCISFVSRIIFFLLYIWCLFIFLVCAFLFICHMLYHFVTKNGRSLTIFHSLKYGEYITFES